MVNDFTARLQSLECGYGWCQCHRTTQTGRGLTHCPAHGPDHHPSLSVTTDLGGTTLVHCFTGCNQLKLWETLFGKEGRAAYGLPPRTGRNMVAQRSRTTVIPE